MRGYGHWHVKRRAHRTGQFNFLRSNAVIMAHRGQHRADQLFTPFWIEIIQSVQCRVQTLIPVCELCRELPIIVRKGFHAGVECLLSELVSGMAMVCEHSQHRANLRVDRMN